MSNINSFISIGSILLLSLISLRFNSTVLENNIVETENKIYLTAFSLADDMIEEIKGKAFDEETVEWHSITESELTSTEAFGPDAGEVSVSDFDDIDDYNGYSKAVSLPHAENYTVITTVDYVTAADQNVTSVPQTFFKRISVSVSSPYLSYPINVIFIFTLHSK